MGYKKAIVLLTKIVDQGLTEELKKQAEKEIKKFIEKRGNYLYET